MEIKAELKQPYTENERINFIVEQNHKNGYEIKETENALQAWGKTETEVLQDLKVSKQKENTRLAKLAVENGHVVFKGAEFETNAQTVGDLTATMLMLQAQQDPNATYLWLSKDDKVVELTLEDFGTLGGLIAEYKNTIWQRKYLYFKDLIESATTIEEVDIINIDYTIEWLTLTIKPTTTNATVLIDGEPATTKTKVTYNFEPATFEYLVVADGYTEKTGKVSIAENTELEIELETSKAKNLN